MSNMKYKQSWAVIDFCAEDGSDTGTVMRTVDYCQSEREADQLAAELASENPGCSYLVGKVFYHLPVTA